MNDDTNAHRRPPTFVLADGRAQNGALYLSGILLDTASRSAIPLAQYVDPLPETTFFGP
jgi:hypothetical protein